MTHSGQKSSSNQGSHSLIIITAYISIYIHTMNNLKCTTHFTDTNNTGGCDLLQLWQVQNKLFTKASTEIFGAL